MEAMSLVASIVSVILGGFALFLSAYFFINTKNTENKVENTLEGIKSQTEALQKITLRQLDRLTKYATDNSPFNEILMNFLPSANTTPSNVDALFSQLEVEKTEKEGLIAELINAYIGMYYYCAVTNVIAQGQLPPLEEYEANLPTSEMIKEIINKSASYFYSLKAILNDNSRIHPYRITASSFNEIYKTTETNWSALVKDSTQVYAERESS